MVTDKKLANNTVSRLLRYAGKDRSQVSNPNITAREAIYIADAIAALQSERDQLHKQLNETRDCLRDVTTTASEWSWDVEAVLRDSGIALGEYDEQQEAQA